MMKPAVFFTAVSLVALSAAGLGPLNAATEADKMPIEVTETVSGGATVAQDADMSGHGLAAMNAVHLARVAINDGYVDSAKRLLDEAHTLLGRVSSEDVPVTVTTEVKVGDTESVGNASHHSTANRGAAVGQAREQLSNGDRQGAIETLRLVDLELVSRTLSMPLMETNAHVDKAIALLDAGKLHEANLELKQAKEGLVADTAVMVEPTEAAKPDQAKSGPDAGKQQPAPQANTMADPVSPAIAHAK